MRERTWIALLILAALLGYFIGYEQGSKRLPPVAVEKEATQKIEPPLPAAEPISQRLSDSSKPATERHDSKTTSKLEVKVNPNTATIGQLTDLPGIGPVLAGRIVASREKLGAFKNLSDLQRVQGIGPKLLEKITPFVVVGEE